MLALHTMLLGTLASTFFGLLVSAAPAEHHVTDIESRQSSSRLVFAHFMIGIVGDRTSSADFDADMQRAKSIGIDAFALNIGVDPYTDTQLTYAYQSAANNGMKVFISFDFNWWTTSQATQIGQLIAQYASQPAQLKVNGAAFVSSFAGDGLDVNAVRSAADTPLFFAPNFHPGQGDFSTIDGALNWIAWPNNGNNKAPTPGANVTVQQGDTAYVNALAGKPYIAPASAWFSTHYGPEVSYSKNWVFPGDSLWFDRWNEILALGPQFVEIVTWNDYGESHYIGPLSSKHTDDGASKWVNDMPHDGWLDLAAPFIAAYKAGATSVNSHITSDKIIYWYRQNPKSLDCNATDTCEVPANNASGNYFLGPPNGWETLSDSVFAASLLTSAGNLTINSGPNTEVFSAPAGASLFQVPLGLGQQSFILSRNGAAVAGMSGASLKDVTGVCNCGIYNFNAYVGALPSESVDPLGGDGITSLPVGLHVSTCAATASLPTSAGSITATGAGQPTGTAKASSTATTAGSTAPGGSTTPTPTTLSLTSTGASVTPTGTCLTMITASSQIFPTNCLSKGECWGGPKGEDPPDYCDGS